MAATSKDVARLAGVSQPTVSRALRGLTGVSDETRRRIEEAAETLGYLPSHAGRALVTRRTRRVGIVVADLTNPFYPHLVAPLLERFARAGYRSVLFAEDEREAVRAGDLADDSLDGVVLTTTLSDSPLPAELRRRRMPFVFLNREGEGPADASVMDDDGGAALLADLLVAAGHRRFGAVMGPAGTSTGRGRRAGFARALAAHGLELPAEATIVSRAYGYPEGRDGLRALLDLPVVPSAVFCANDVLALGALDEATRLGIRVPEDLSVVGFDDIGLAGWERFRLTTVHTDLELLAGVAADLLLHRIADPDADPQRVVQQPQLVLRGTHGRAPARRTGRRPTRGRSR